MVGIMILKTTQSRTIDKKMGTQEVLHLLSSTHHHIHIIDCNGEARETFRNDIMRTWPRHDRKGSRHLDGKSWST